MRDFPRGSCGDSSILLGEYLHQKGWGIWDYVGGERESDLHSHAWLEKDGLIIDITADQFDGMDEAVIVSRDSSWHRQFIYREPAHPALIEVYDKNTRTNLNRAFSRIMATLEQSQRIIDQHGNYGRALLPRWLPH